MPEFKTLLDVLFEGYLFLCAKAPFEANPAETSIYLRAYFDLLTTIVAQTESAVAEIQGVIDGTD